MKIPQSTGSFSSLAVLPDGSLASCVDNRNIDVWNIYQGKIIKTLRGHTDAILTLITMNEDILVSGSLDKTIKIWKNYQVAYTLNGHSDFVWTLVGLSNELLASGSNDNTIKIWNITNGKLIKTFNVHSTPVLSVVVLLDDN